MRHSLQRRAAFANRWIERSPLDAIALCRRAMLGRLCGWNTATSAVATARHTFAVDEPAVVGHSPATPEPWQRRVTFLMVVALFAGLDLNVQSCFPAAAADKWQRA